jgi:hypothetical protein
VLRVHTTFFTVTSSLEAPADISHSWDILKKRLDRRYGWPRPARRTRSTRNRRVSFWKVRTNEGQSSGVIHSLLRTNRYIPQRLLSRWWRQIHKSPIVDIRRTKNNKIARYLTSQYLSKQCTFQRQAFSRDWLGQGMTGLWKQTKTRMRELYPEEPTPSASASQVSLDTRKISHRRPLWLEKAIEAYRQLQCELAWKGQPFLRYPSVEPG